MPNSLRFPGSETITAEKAADANSRSLFLQAVWIAIALALVLLCTRAVEIGDTQVYAHDMTDHIGKSPFGAGNSLWEFGHLLWRPLGWAVFSLASPVLSALTSWTPDMQAIFVLIAVSTPFAFVAVMSWYAIAVRATGSRGVAYFVAFAVACTHGFLLYSHAGCAYIPGVACVSVSLYFLMSRKIAAGAAFYALAALLWFPFILSGLALLLLAGSPSEDWNKSLRERFRQFDWNAAIRFTVIAATAVLLVYGFALYARRISSVAEAKAWYASAGHGFSQTGRVVRAATGLPRSFLYLAKDGILYKRFLHHDPYAPVTLWDLAGASLWKLAAFYLFVACLFYRLVRQGPSRWMLVLTAAGSVPVLFFAVAIFEPGSPERYLPALPFLVLATAWVLRDLGSSRRPTQILIAAFLVCVVLTNGYSFVAPRVSAQNAGSLARVSDLRTRLNSAGLVMVATNQDALEETMSRLTFDNINRPAPLRVYDIVENGNFRILTWRQDLAAQTLKVWENGGDVWVSKRVWSPRPQPSWNWVEGDDARISWAELPRFFATVDTDAESGGPDGFLRIARNDANLTMLTSLAASRPALHQD
jgi:hypothetical protein